jgi:hypothetical protein
MSARHEAGVERQDTPDSFEAVFSFIEETTERLHQFHELTELLIPRLDPITGRLHTPFGGTSTADILASRQAWGIEMVAGSKAVTELIQANGGIPIKYLDDKSGAEISTYLIHCCGYDLAGKSWLMIGGMPGQPPMAPALEITMAPHEVRQSYLQATQDL